MLILSANADAVKSNICKLEYRAEKEGGKTAIINAMKSGVKERKHTDAGIELDVVRRDCPEFKQKIFQPFFQSNPVGT